MNQKLWSNEDLGLLKAYLKTGMTYRQIASKMDRSIDSVGHAVTRYDLNKFKASAPKAEKIIESIELEELDDNNFENFKQLAKLKWKIAKSEGKSNGKVAFKTALIYGDVHAPHHNEVAIKSILKLADDVKFDMLINIGDFLDYGCISHWNQNKHKTLEMKRLKNDYIIGNAILDEFDKRMPKNCEKHFFKGNHELWIQDLLEKTPQLEGLIEPESQLFLVDRKYKVYEYNDVVAFGKLNITHGIYACANAVKKHVDELKTNILFGHTHTIASMLSSSPAREIAFSAYNIGCLCDMAPDYMKNRPHGWSHGFAVAYFFPNGYFDVQIIRIIEGKFIFNNKLYSGN